MVGGYGVWSCLVSKNDIYAMKKFVKASQRPLTFHSANGDSFADEQCDLWFEELGEAVRPYILKSTPAVLSVGFRCMELGYTFIWPTGKAPYFITPKGMIVECEVHNHIPYLRPGSVKTRPRHSKGFCGYACSSTCRLRRRRERMAGTFGTLPAMQR